MTPCDTIQGLLLYSLPPAQTSIPGPATGTAGQEAEQGPKASPPDHTSRLTLLFHPQEREQGWGDWEEQGVRSGGRGDFPDPNAS